MGVRYGLLFVLTVAASSCRWDTSPGRGLSPTATTTIRGADTAQTLETVVTLTNAGSSPVHIAHGSCDVHVVAYTNAQRTGTPVWNSDFRRAWVGTYHYACDAVGIVGTLSPGKSLTSSFQAPLIEMLADSLPDGRYYFSADFLLGEPGPVTAIPAGSIDLVLPRAPLPAARNADLITYQASPVSIDGASTVRARVTASLVFAGGALVTFSHDCPLVLAAYRDRARRDAAPRSGAADWTQPLVCGTTSDVVSMNRGDSRTLDTSVAMADILGASLADGHYYFTVAVYAQGNRVVLSAGDADLHR